MSKPKNSNCSDAATIARLFVLDADTGVVRRRVQQGNRPAGEIVGQRRKDGYLGVGVYKRGILLHRVVWCLAYGNWPAGVIDHIDGNQVNNRPDNLRDVTQSVNILNQHKGRKSRVGLRGVDLLPSGKYRARIKGPNRSSAHIGIFNTAEQAHQAHQEAMQRVLGGAK